MHWGLGSPDLVRIGMNAIFAAGPVVLRVSRPSAPGEAALELHDDAPFVRCAGYASRPR